MLRSLTKDRCHVLSNVGHVSDLAGAVRVYFPTTAIVSLLYVMRNGESAEIAVVGNDGVVGVSLFMGGDSTSSRALVQSAGGADHADGSSGRLQ
jgi:hypothetical protein